MGDRQTDEGSDYEFADEVPSKYVCTICTKVLRRARLAECCGQHFCDSCLTQWMRRSQRSCPHCRSVNFQSVINKEKIREINEFRVYCTNRTSGCQWLGQLGTLEEHLQSENGCGYVKVSCDNECQVHMYNYGFDKIQVCNVVVQRRCLTTHKEKECKYRRYTCQYCNYVDTYEAIAGSDPTSNSTMNHYATCEYYPLECANACGAVAIKRKDMKAHRDTCPLESLSCPFNCCKELALRKDMDSHKVICDFRPYTCEYCGTKGTFLYITNMGKFWQLSNAHYDSCQHYPLECVNKCSNTNIKRKDMRIHRNNCPLEPLVCPLGTHHSGTKILRKNIEKHTRDECEFRRFTCQYCKSVGTYISITGKGETPLKTKCHHDVCQDYPLNCPNRCGADNIKRKNMSNHRSKCPLEPLDCPFKYVKCNVKVLRKDMDSHYQNHMQNHLLLLAKSHEKLSKSHETLTRKVDELSAKLSKSTISKTRNMDDHASCYTYSDGDPGYDYYDDDYDD